MTPKYTSCLKHWSITMTNKPMLVEQAISVASCLHCDETVHVRLPAALHHGLQSDSCGNK